MKLPYIEWTKVEPTAVMKLEGEPTSAIDGTDQEFYETPWCEADTGDIFAHHHPGEEPLTVHMAEKEDDNVAFWRVPDEHVEAALVVLKKARKVHLREEIATLTVEFKALA